MEQNLSESKILHESSKLEHFHGGGGGGLQILDLSKFQFPTITIFVIFCTGGKNY